MTSHTLSTQDLDRAVRSYVETALWATTDQSDDTGGRPLDERFDITDVEPGSMEEIRETLAGFFASNADDIAAVIERDGATIERVAHDFFLTRERHGAGFWDGDYSEPYATRLTDASHAYGPADFFAGQSEVYGS